ncbi:MAG: ABC transporter ATP-binding protein [Armatimonadetes bacterium]|nr:ABC transporter ATP-binding protein [Armatimonadota bacterium]
MPEPLAELSEVEKVWSGGAGRVAAVAGVSLEVLRGDFGVITGRSGSGKSTLLALLGGLTRPSAGTVTLFGHDLGGLSDDGRAALRATRLGFVFQFAGLVPTLTAFDNVRLRTLFGVPPGRDTDLAARDLLRRVGLGHRLDAYADELSGGEQRRVAIARALLGGPDLLLADEPTGDLDTATEAEIMTLLAELHRDGLTILMVTHNLELRQFANRSFEMRDGRLQELQPA